MVRKLCVAALCVGVLAPLSAQRLPSRVPDPVGPPPARTRPAPSSPTTSATRPAQSRPVGPDKVVPFVAGETLTYDVSWSEFLTAGSATVTVRERRPSFGSTAWYIVAEGRPTALVSKLYSLYYKVDTLLDTRTLLPQRGSIFSQEGRRQRMKETQFDHQARRATYVATTRTTVREEQRLSGVTHDALSALYALRMMSFAPGASTTFAVFDSGEMYRVTARVVGRETVPTGAGTISAWKVVPAVTDEQGQPFGEGLALWVSDDPQRMPVKMQAKLPVGSFVLTLAGHS